MNRDNAERQDVAQAIYRAALEAGYDNCGIIALEDMEPYQARLEERMESVPQSKPFYEPIRASADLKRRFPWAKSLLVCTVHYGKYRYPEQLQGRYAKGFLLSTDSMPAEARAHRKTLPQWLDEQGIRWDRGPIYGLRYAALQAGLGIIRKNNFFYDEKGSWLELEGYLIDVECRLYQKHAIRACSPKCNLCAKNCPTGSLSAPYTMNPFHCISYCTTFGGGNVPEGVDERTFGEWTIGCDRCQDVCPFNRHDWSAGEVYPGLDALTPL